jgi:hypothetical protein
MWYVDRYSIFLGLLMLPYAVFLFKEIAVYTRLKPVFLLVPFIILSALANKQIIKTNTPHLPSEIKRVATWLKRNALASDKIILGTDGWDATDSDIIVRSSISPDNFFVVTRNLASPEYNSRILEVLKYFIDNSTPRYLILNSTGFLHKLINLDMDKSDLLIFGYPLKLAFCENSPEFGRFNIYEINYKTR